MPLEGLGKLLKIIYLIGSRTGGIPACNLVTQTGGHVHQTI
jgi:hypothetical protein